MSLLTHLDKLASDTLLRGTEREKNKHTAQILEERLAAYFQDQIKDVFAYGSSIRGTSLPQFFSESIDIDYMVVFHNDDCTPATYTRRLVDFAQIHYPRSRVFQSTPAVCIQMAHLTFELVPALPAFWNDFKIPTARGDWQGANPRGLEKELARSNQRCNGALKPAVRLAKLWNTRAGHVFSSFDLETQAAAIDFGRAKNLRDHFVVLLDGLRFEPFADTAMWRTDALARAQSIAKEALAFEAREDSLRAIRTINKIFI